MRVHPILYKILRKRYMKFFTRSVISPLCKRPRPTTFGLTVARCAIIGALGFAAHMQCAYAAQTSAVVSQQTGEQHVSASSQKSDKTLLTTSADSKATGKDSTSNTSSKDNTIDAVDLSLIHISEPTRLL